MKTNKWPIAVFPVILLIFFLVTIQGMKIYESKITHLYKEHTLLLEQLVKTNNANVRSTLLRQFSNKIELSISDKAVIAAGTKAQQIIDLLTPGISHCLVKTQSSCKMYTQEVIGVAKTREHLLVVISKEFHEDPIASGVQYSLLELFTKALVLLVEGAAASLIVHQIIKRVK
ncbi:MAG TPA: hypothetical protein VJJ82_00540 [Candidatus Nanoarchaeia archaeon]|nr:hypothetical protein [Candidatus Nanoarchaeia archaeon]